MATGRADDSWVLHVRHNTGRHMAAGRCRWKQGRCDILRSWLRTGECACIGVLAHATRPFGGSQGLTLPSLWQRYNIRERLRVSRTHSALHVAEERRRNASDKGINACDPWCGLSAPAATTRAHPRPQTVAPDTHFVMLCRSNPDGVRIGEVGGSSRLALH